MRYFWLITFIISFISWGLYFPTPLWARLISADDMVTIPANEVIDDDLFIAANQVNILGTVNGDVYVGAGNVEVSGRINGDLLVGAGTIRISGPIRDDVRIAGGNITTSDASIGGSLTTFGGNITVDQGTSAGESVIFGAGSYVFDGSTERNLVGGGGNVIVNGTVVRQIQVGAGNLRLSQNARVGGDVEYSSDRQIQVDSAASVSGTVRQIFHEDKRNQDRAESALAGLAFGFTLWSLVAFSVISLLFWWLFSTFSNQVVEYAGSNPGWSALWGFLILILTVPVLVILAITVIGIPLAFIGMLAFFLALYLAKLFPAVYIGTRIVKLTSPTRLPWMQILIGLVIYYSVGLIPVLGWLATLIWMIIGMGALVAIIGQYLRGNLAS